MAKCECGREMLTEEDCVFDMVHVNGLWMRRVGFGRPADLARDWAQEGDRCHDCNAIFGGYHHVGCDGEACPCCGRQMLSCDCDIDMFGVSSKRDKALKEKE